MITAGSVRPPVQMPTLRRIAPAVTLLLLAPVLSEVLFGTTRITTLFVVIPQTGIWGCAALPIDRIGQVVANMIAALLLTLFWRKDRHAREGE